MSGLGEPTVIIYKSPKWDKVDGLKSPNYTKEAQRAILWARPRDH